MASQWVPRVDVAAVLANSLFEGRTRLGEKIEEIARGHKTIAEYKLDDGTPVVPPIRIATQRAVAALPGLERHRTVVWQVAGRQAQHILVCFTPQDFTQAVEADSFTSVLQAAERSYPTYRLHLLTWSPNTNGERLWQLAADLAVCRPDVALHVAKDVADAAEHAHRITRAVAEEDWKKTSTRGYLSALPQQEQANQKRQRLETLLVRHGMQRGGSAAALMRMLLAIPGVGPEAAYAVGAEYKSLQGLMEAVERHGAASTQADVARLVQPASTSVVGPSTADKIMRLVT